MMRPGWKEISGFAVTVFTAALLWVPAWGATLPPQPIQRQSAQIGTINSFEGHAFIGTQALTPNDIGSILGAGQTLGTQDGRAEILLGGRGGGGGHR